MSKRVPGKSTADFVPRLGAAYHFTPAAFLGENAGGFPERSKIPRSVTGRIIYINWAHRYFTVAYEVHGYELKEGIKF